MTHKYLILTILLFFGLNAISQVLYSENFDSQPLGPLNTDTTGTIPGKANWYRSGYHQVPILNTDIITHNGTNKVLAIKNGNSDKSSRVELILKDIDLLWTNRTVGNDVMKIEYDMYLDMTDRINYSLYSYQQSGLGHLRYFCNTAYNNYIDGSFLNSSGGQTAIKFDSNGATNYSNFPNKVWTKIIFYFDTANKVSYFNIPSLNLYDYSSYYFQALPTRIELESSRNIINLTSTYQNPFLMYDNFKIEAIKNVPLSSVEFLNTKFEIYPNPTTDIITIKNEENILIKNIDIIDLNGRIIKSIKPEEQHTQLNLDFLAAGTYLLNIKTDQGTAAKKIVKK